MDLVLDGALVLKEDDLRSFLVDLDEAEVDERFKDDDRFRFVRKDRDYLRKVIFRDNRELIAVIHQHFRLEGHNHLHAHARRLWAFDDVPALELSSFWGD